MSKPLKEWGVVKFLTKKLPEAAGDIVGNVAEVATGQKTIFQAVGSVLAGNKDKLSPEDIAKVYELAQLDHERYKEELKDMVLGGIVGTGLGGVFQFFFGSSSGSKNKEGIIKTFIEKVR